MPAGCSWRAGGRHVGRRRPRARGGAPARDAREVGEHERGDPDAHARRLVQRTQHWRQLHADHRASHQPLQHAERDGDHRCAPHHGRLTALPQREEQPDEVEHHDQREHAMRELHVHRRRATSAFAPQSGKLRHATAAPGNLAVSPPITTVTSAIAAPANAARFDFGVAPPSSALAPPSPPARITVAATVATRLIATVQCATVAHGHVAVANRHGAEQRCGEAKCQRQRGGAQHATTSADASLRAPLPGRNDERRDAEEQNRREIPVHHLDDEVHPAERREPVAVALGPVVPQPMPEPEMRTIAPNTRCRQATPKTKYAKRRSEFMPGP